jgi:RND family efflux transporter MFP subunit
MMKLFLVIWLLGVGVAAAQDAVPVQVRELSALLSPVVFTAPAEVVTANRSRISARVEARIDTLPVNVGDPVEAGQVIVELDCIDNELSLERAEAELQSAQAQLKRATRQLARSETLARDTLLSKDLLEERQTGKEAAEARERQARAMLKQAELSVSRCRIASPFDGVVTGRLAAKGELARPGTPLLEIVDLQSIEVAAQVFPSELKELESSPRVFLSFLDEEYPLRIDRRTPVIDPVTRTQEVRLGFSGRGAPVGASGRLVWHGKDPGIPASLLVQRDDRLGIFVARDGTAVFHVLPHAREGRPAMVDLPPDTSIVTEGHQALRDGDSLDIAN